MAFKTVHDQQRAVEAAALENAKRACIAEVYAEHQDFVRCEANDRRIIELIDRWTGYNPDVMPTKAIFDQMIFENPDALKSLSRQPLAVAKEKVIDEYVELLSGHSRQDHFSLQQQRKRLNHLSLEVCREKLQELKARQKMSAQPTPILKAFVANAKERSADGYPRLPEFVWDGMKHVRVDAVYLNRLIQTDMWQFKKLVRLYGSKNVDRARGIK